MSETLSQYSALMVMEREYGRAKINKFLKHELNRYLLGRATEREKEQPLMYVENQQYIHYAKGSLVMYTLREYLGEDVLNAALAKYIKAVAYQAPPYTTSLEFVEILREATPKKYAYLIEDLFETITLYDNRAETAVATKTDGGWDVELTVKSTKFRADESGAEESIPLHDWVELGVLDADGNFLYREKHLLDAEVLTVTLSVDEEPARAGVDPTVMLVDRNPDDNTVAVELR